MCVRVCVCLVSGLGVGGLNQPVAFFLRSASLFSFLDGAELSFRMDACFRSSSVITNTGLFLTSWETQKKQTLYSVFLTQECSMDMYDRRLYLLSFLLHGFIKQCEAVADELLADDDCASQHSGRGLDVSVSHGLVDQHPHVLHWQAAGQNRLKQPEWETEASNMVTINSNSCNDK